MTKKQTLIKQYNVLEDAIDQASVNEVWELARWLVANVPSFGGGNHKVPLGTLTIKDIAAERGRSAGGLREMRRTALAFGDRAVLGIVVKEHTSALRQAKGDVDKAIEIMLGEGSDYKKKAKKAKKEKYAKEKKTGVKSVQATPARALIAAVSFVNTATKRVPTATSPGYQVREMRKLISILENATAAVTEAVDTREADRQSKRLARESARCQTPEYRARKSAWNQTPEYRAAKRARSQTAEYRAVKNASQNARRARQRAAGERVT